MSYMYIRPFPKKSALPVAVIFYGILDLFPTVPALHDAMCRACPVKPKSTRVDSRTGILVTMPGAEV